MIDVSFWKFVSSEDLADIASACDAVLANQNAWIDSTLTIAYILSDYLEMLPAEFSSLSEMIGIREDIFEMDIGDESLYTKELYAQKIAVHEEIEQNDPPRVVAIAREIQASMQAFKDGGNC